MRLGTKFVGVLGQGFGENVHQRLHAGGAGDRGGHVVAGDARGAGAEGLKQRRGVPEAIVVDNGPEFISRAVDQWAFENGVELYFIEPGKPTRNAYIESFNGKFRDECLNQNWFVDLADARRVIEAWRVGYNTARPHSSLGYLTPTEFAQIAAAGNGCGKDGRFATLEIPSGFPLSHSPDGVGSSITVFGVESRTAEATL